MLHHIAADAVLIVHFAFVAFVVAGGVLILRWPRLAWLHVPAVFWGVVVEFSGWICPLTPLENALREHSGDKTYGGDFVQHYLVSLLYPEELTRGTQWLLGLLVIALNALFYSILLFRTRGGETPRAR